jgi:hypothetical protein
MVFPAACAPTDTRDDARNVSGAISVRDSAGVAIIENPETGDTLSVRELVRIGSVAGRPDYELFGIFHVAVDANGAYYVGMPNGISVYDARGAFVRRIGRKGQGPGEFNMAPVVWFAGDSVMALDRNLMRTTAFDTTGRVLGTWNSSSHPGLWITPRARHGTTWIAEVEPIRDLADEQNVQRINIAVGERYDPPPTVLLRYDPVHDVLGDTVYHVPRTSLRGSAQSESGVARPLFSSEPAYAFDGSGNLYVTSADEYRIDVFDTDGRLVRSIRRAYDHVPITPADLDSLPELLVEGYAASMTGASREQYRRQMLPRMRETVQRQTGAAPLPAARHALGRILVSRGGTILLERADAVAPAVRHAQRVTGRPLPPTRWDLFVDGRYQGTINLAPGFRAWALSDDGSVTGVMRDESDVEFVVTLVPSPRGAAGTARR